MRDDLLGFLLGALDESEQDELREKLEQQPVLREQLEHLRRGLKPLRAAEDDCLLPAGLAVRTCRLVESLNQRNPAGALGRCDLTSEPEGGEALVTTRQVARFSSRVDRSAASIERSWTMADFIVAAGVCLAAACMFLPAVSNSRYHSQRVACENNQRLLSYALNDYSSANRGYFPVVPARGNLAAAGIYAPLLMEKGFVEDSNLFSCPAKGSKLIVRIPLPEDIRNAKGPQLVTLHQSMGGDYAYSLGFVANGRLHGVKNQGRTHYAVLGDAPIEQLTTANLTTHGRGQNVLFEDGHVQFLTKRSLPSRKADDLFLNDDGRLEAGLHPNDAVLAPSATPPLPVMNASYDLR